AFHILAQHTFFTDAIDDSHSIRFPGIYHRTGKKKLACLSFTNFSDEKRHDDRRHKSNLNFGVSKRCLCYREREITNGDKTTSSGNGGSLHLGDHNLRMRVDLPEE